MRSQEVIERDRSRINLGDVFSISERFHGLNFQISSGIDSIVSLRLTRSDSWEEAIATCVAVGARLTKTKYAKMNEIFGFDC